MIGPRVYLLSAVAVVVTTVGAIPRPFIGNGTAPVIPTRNATTGQRVNSTSSANNTVPLNRNVTINNITITGSEGAQAACDRGLTQFCLTRREDGDVEGSGSVVDDLFEQLDDGLDGLVKRIGNGTAPVIPSRNATTGQRVNSTSSANNTVPINRNVTINNITITGSEGAQAACDRGLTQFCLTRRDDGDVEENGSIVDDLFETLDGGLDGLVKRIGNATAPVIPSRNATTGQRVNSTSSANNTIPLNRNVTINNITITGSEGRQAACDRGLTQWCDQP